MKLIIPHTGQIHGTDARLMRLAQFLGVTCEPLRLDKQVQQTAAYLEKALPDRNGCLLVNPQVIRDWVAKDVLPGELVSCVASRFPYLLVHGLSREPFVSGMVAALSSGGLAAVRPVADSGRPYEVSGEASDFAGPFRGLSFGCANQANDRVFGVGSGAASRSLICVNGSPFMSVVHRESAETIFVASEDAADIDTHAGYHPIDTQFSRFVPQAMALRHIFGQECWRPPGSHAAVMIDDPLLRPNYGFLNFENLLQLMKQHNFHTAVAFIPYNYRRNSARILRMFRENSRYLSICFHGNDHTGLELASRDTAFLNATLAIADERMSRHFQATGLRCDRAMVFPQAEFSVEAMQVLKSRNFCAGVGSGPYPTGQPAPLTIAELSEPAILRYAGFPLFLRSAARDTRSQDVAFSVFFGKPVLIVEHHDLLQDPEGLIELAHRINSVAPDIGWLNLDAALSKSVLQRRGEDQTVEIQAYSTCVSVENDSGSQARVSILWRALGPSSSCQILRDGTIFSEWESGVGGIRVQTELAPGACQVFSVVYPQVAGVPTGLGFRWNSKVFVRRRLSEFRDNFLSKSPQVLKLAQSLKARLVG